MYLIYNVETTKLYGGSLFPKRYTTSGAAKTALTKAINSGKIKSGEYAVCDSNWFTNIEKKEVVLNLMSGLPVVQSVNTPLCCDPSSETYWCM